VHGSATAIVLRSGSRTGISAGQCGWCRDHSGDAVIGVDPLPPYHPSCSCTASAV
jgi:hypothetical protein